MASSTGAAAIATETQPSVEMSSVPVAAAPFTLNSTTVPSSSLKMEETIAGTGDEASTELVQGSAGTEPLLAPSAEPTSEEDATIYTPLAIPPSSQQGKPVESIQPDTQHTSTADMPDSPIEGTESNTNEPVININLLLTTGARHPYRISDRYLKKRQVYAENNDPFNISVYTLKELIWREWREEWEQRPLSPTAIRLIHFGRLLDDKVPIKECRFSLEGPNVVHLTVKPQDLIDEDIAQKGKRVVVDTDDVRSGGLCRCIIL